MLLEIYLVQDMEDAQRPRRLACGGFFALDDIDAISDAELYERILLEFPDWVRAARAAKIIA